MLSWHRDDSHTHVICQSRRKTCVACSFAAFRVRNTRKWTRKPKGKNSQNKRKEVDGLQSSFRKSFSLKVSLVRSAEFAASWLLQAAQHVKRDLFRFHVRLNFFKQDSLRIFPGLSICLTFLTAVDDDEVKKHC